MPADAAIISALAGYVSKESIGYVSAHLLKNQPRVELKNETSGLWRTWKVLLSSPGEHPEVFLGLTTKRDIIQRSIMLVLQYYCVWDKKDDKRSRELVRKAVASNTLRMVPNSTFSRRVGMHYARELIVDAMTIRYLATKLPVGLTWRIWRGNVTAPCSVAEVLSMCVMRATRHLAVALECISRRWRTDSPNRTWIWEEDDLVRCFERSWAWESNENVETPIASPADTGALDSDSEHGMIADPALSIPSRRRGADLVLYKACSGGELCKEDNSDLSGVDAKFRFSFFTLSKMRNKHRDRVTNWMRNVDTLLATNISPEMNRINTALLAHLQLLRKFKYICTVVPDKKVSSHLYYKAIKVAEFAMEVCVLMMEELGKGPKMEKGWTTNSNPVKEMLHAIQCALDDKFKAS